MIQKPSNTALCALLFLFVLLTAPLPAMAEMEDYPVVKLQSLDKSTARTMTFEARVGSTVKFGSLYIKVQSCRKAPPIDTPEAASFLQIWEVTPDEKASWVFSGWMFASSPALSAMDHPIYDVWVIDCMGQAETASVESADGNSEQAGDDDAHSDDGIAPEDAPVPEEGPSE